MNANVVSELYIDAFTTCFRHVSQKHGGKLFSISQDTQFGNCVISYVESGNKALKSAVQQKII